MECTKAMEKSCSVWESGRGIQAVQLAAAQHLEAKGLTAPRGEPDLHLPTNVEIYKCAFGTSLSNQPTFSYQWRDCTFNLPRIFVVLVKFLDGHVCDVGLFRKAGSVSRQRTLRALLEAPRPSLPLDCNVHDVASLFKQFLRELPHLLLPAHYWPLMEACVSLVPAKDQPKCLQLASLLLPSLHLQCLCVVMDLLNRISRGAGHSLMDAGSLAVVMAPNLVSPSNHIRDLHDHSLRVQRRIVRLLIDDAGGLGLVPQEVEETANNISLERAALETRSLDDMLRGQGDPLPNSDAKHRKLTASSISGLLSGWSNKILRRRAVAGGAEQRSLKRSQQDTLERPVKRPALGAPAGCATTPLVGWWSLRKKGVAKRSTALHRSPLRLGDSMDGDASSETDATSCGSVDGSGNPSPSPDDHTPNSTLISSSSLCSSHTPNSTPSLLGDHASNSTPYHTPNSSLLSPSPRGGHTHNSSLLSPPPRGGHAHNSSLLVPPSPLLYSSLHAAKLRHSKTTLSLSFSTVRESAACSPHAQQCPVSTPGREASSSPAPVSTGADSQSCDKLQGEPSDRLLATPTGCGQFGGAVLRDRPTESPNLMDKICTEMAWRSYNRYVLCGGKRSQQVSAGEKRVKACGNSSRPGEVKASIHPGEHEVGNQESGERSNQDRHLEGSDDASVLAPPVSRKRRGNCSHYSATLGIDMLPRRKLRRCEPAADDCLVEEEPRSLQSSPVVHSASLGITELGVTGSRPRRGRRRERKAGNATPSRESHDATGTTLPPIVKNSTKPTVGGNIAPLNAPLSSSTVVRKSLIPLNPTPTTKSRVQGPLCPLNPPPPTTKSGVQGPLCPLNPPPTTKSGVQCPLNPPPPTTKSGGQGPLCPLNPPPTTKSGVQGPLCPLNHAPSTVELSQQSRQPRYKSPWRWASLRSRRDYTPVKSKGAISKRAQAYMVNLPRPSSCHAGFLRESSSSTAENMPPLDLGNSEEVKGRRDDISVAVEEWVL